MVMGNVTLNQLGHFLILMTYMSFCRIGHYTPYMREEDAINLEIAVLDEYSHYGLQNIIPC